jgi:hypothetical protein
MSVMAKVIGSGGLLLKAPSSNVAAFPAANVQVKLLGSSSAPADTVNSAVNPTLKATTHLICIYPSTLPEETSRRGRY